MTRAGLIAVSLTVALTATSASAEPPILKIENAVTAQPDAAVIEPKVAVAPVAPPPPAITLVAKVDLSAQRVTVLANGKAIHTWPISSGARDFATPTGNFKPAWMAKVWFSKQYDNAPMPNAVFFNGGIAMHATQAIGSLGRPASHGCVRLSPTNAATFYGLVTKHGLTHTRISVFGAPKFAPVAVASRVERNQIQPRIAYGRQIYANNGYGYQGGYQGYQGYGNGGGGSIFYSQPQPMAYRAVRYAPIQYRVR
jgi:L,D-transpeptidase catalytic domain